MRAPIGGIDAVLFGDPDRRDLEAVQVFCVPTAGAADSCRRRPVGKDDQGIGRLHAPSAGQDQEWVEIHLADLLGALVPQLGDTDEELDQRLHIGCGLSPEAPQ
jgi:hypothetical protein